MLKVYCDESSDQKSKRILIMAALFGSDEEWKELEKLWQKELDQANIPEFHMVDCENARGYFKHMHPNKRRFLQRKFIDLISDSPVEGKSAGIVLNDFKSLYERVKRVSKIPPKRAVTGDLADPYFRAFWAVIELVNESILLNKKDQVSFTFDKHQLKGRADYMFQLLKKRWGDQLELVECLFGDRAKNIPLQAVDVLAYECFRYFDGTFMAKKPLRWQWKIILNKVHPEGVHYMDKEMLEKLLIERLERS